MLENEAHDRPSDPCELFGGKKSLTERIITRLGHCPEIQTAIAQNANNSEAAIRSLTRAQILDLCIREQIALEELMGPIGWESEEQKQTWLRRMRENMRIIDTVSLGDAIASVECPGHPDLTGHFLPHREDGK